MIAPLLSMIDAVAATHRPAWTVLASVAAGGLVGLSLGLTGGGGAIFAVPLLVYGIGVDPRTAVSISLVTVTATALVGAAERWWYGEVEVRTGLLFAAAGMVTAPAGGWLGGQVPPQTLMAAFAGLMLLIAGRMWQKAADRTERASAGVFAAGVGPTCSRDAEGRLRMTTRCFVLLALVGLAVGLLSGLFGVGGGFLIVPALVAFATMDVFRAIGTSLFVMTLVGAAAVAAQVAAGRSIPIDVAGSFVGGGVPALFVGSWAGRRIGGPTLARIFSVAIVLVAAFIIFKTLRRF